MSFPEGRDSETACEQAVCEVRGFWHSSTPFVYDFFSLMKNLSFELGIGADCGG